MGEDKEELPPKDALREESEGEPNCGGEDHHSLHRHHQSRKNPVSASAMLTGKFLQIQKVFATSSLLAENFRILCNTKYPDNM